MDDKKQGGLWACPIDTYDIRTMHAEDDLLIVDVDTERHTDDGAQRCAWRVTVSWWDGMSSHAQLHRAPDGYAPTARERRAATRHAEAIALAARLGRKVTKRDLRAQRRTGEDAGAPPWLAYLLHLDRSE